MMPEQKGRGGKKPKYQIPDIGGDDLTPEDVSTERVLNFLIKGEAVPAEQADSLSVPSGDKIDEGSSPLTGFSTQNIEDKSLSSSLPSSERPPKKSLAHLYRRASGGDIVAKELPLQLPPDEVEEKPVTRQPAKPEVVQQAAEAAPEASQVAPAPQVSEPTVLSSSSGVNPASANAVSAPELEIAPQITATPEADISLELSRYIELWKNYYRLKPGEVDAITVMYRLTHGKGRTECYIKMHNLAEMSKLTYRYCQKVVRSLEQLGWITKLRDYDPTTQLGVLYKVNLTPQLPSADL